MLKNEAFELFWKKSNFFRHFKGWKCIKLCILCYIFVFLHQLFFVPPPLIYLLGQALWKKLHMRGRYMFYVCLEIHTLLYRSRYLEEDEKKYLFEKVRKNLVVSKLKITRSSISPIGERGYLMFFKSHRIFLLCFRFFDWTRNSGQIYFCNLVYLEKEAIVF